MELLSGDPSRDNDPLLAADIKQVEDELEGLNNRPARQRGKPERDPVRLNWVSL